MTAATSPFLGWVTRSKLEGLESALGDPEPVREARDRAFRAFEELSVEPDPLYRGYSNISGADLRAIDPSVPGAPVAVPVSDPSTLRIIHDASGTRIELPSALADAGVRVRTLPELWAEHAADVSPAPQDKLHALALALVNRAVDLTVPDQCAVPVRVQDITVLSRPHEAISVRRTIHVGTRARLLFTEELYSTEEPGPDAQRLYGSTVTLRTSAESAAHYLTLHAPDLSAVSVYHRHGIAGTRARLAWLWAGFGGLRTKAKSLTEIPGSGAEVEDLQTFYGQGDQAYDSAVQITHQGTDTRGQSITRGVFKDQARGVSRGVVRIEKEARKTLSFLSEHAMLLSPGARSDTIPVLEILCRDVKATHSTSVAPVDPEKVFYLESRGMTPSDAVRMIGEGFLSHVLERAPIAQLRDALYPVLAARWDGRPILWAGEHLPALPPLTVTDEIASEEWRFDAKLR
jgi:Fe-S cluster assembly scaffold protein SufB